ncbi:MAG TPA: nicotinate (nicotinamide) nucleotide adenylyltransferase [Bacteroidia bacterium]|jgi:nicotinate-nucleotide adenylyltransferase|nr:nicotinate (nicotinamide) nucleotide adenylyltransferase [Bacteroidia bacterium]
MPLKSKKIGLFFGSFNPIHIGHLVIAEYMVEFTELDKVWFVISPQNPLKPERTLLSEKQRLQMVRLAIEFDNRFKVSTVEFDLPSPSYTINTLAHLKEKNPKQEFALIMGADNITTLHKWKNYEQLLENNEIYVYPRKESYDIPAYAKRPSVHLTEAPVMEISSTFIRNAIKDKKDVRHMLPLPVAEYIKEMHFYEAKAS